MSVKLSPAKRLELEQRRVLALALREQGFNVSDVARRLGVSRPAVYRLLAPTYGDPDREALQGDDRDRFWAKVDIGGSDECWEWTAGRFATGYGKFWLGGTDAVASRLAWADANGRPVPDGLVVCHSCDNPPCCNPAHLWVGTGRDNSRDMMRKGRHPRSLWVGVRARSEPI